MKAINAFASTALLCAAIIVTACPAMAERVLLSANWAFHAGEATGAQDANYDDTTWHKVIVPNDFSIADRPDGTPPFEAKTPGEADSGYIPGGIGWYRYHFMLDAKSATNTVIIDFEAVYMDADIWVNGVHVAKHPYGYTAFQVDLTGKVTPGRNVVAVRINHQDPSSRWYAGSGIIRPVHLELLDRIHIAPKGTAITTPIANEALGEVAVATTLVNGRNKAAAVVLAAQLLDSTGKVVANKAISQTLDPGKAMSASLAMKVSRPKLWSLESPNLYTLVQTLSVGGKIVDTRKTVFGIRSLDFSAEKGFLLNGKPVKLKGGNIHHDNYMLGAAGFPRADQRKVELMKAAGYNAIRSAHNPASQATLDAADRIGMLVIDEAFDSWPTKKREFDYARFFDANWQSDLTSLIVSGRNHPSVIMWSIGNEIPEQSKSEGVELSRKLAALVHGLDPSRPVTQAISADGPAMAENFAALDVAGYNYFPGLYVPHHQTYPKRIMYGSESFPPNAFDYWRPVEQNPWVIGDFVWTGFDYLGEASIGWAGYIKSWQGIGPYPWHLAYCGEIDATGLMRPNAYYREVLWKTGKHPISAFVQWPDPAGSLPDGTGEGAHRGWVLPDVHQSWNFAGYEGKPLTVEVYSELPEVELTLNGKSLGRKSVSIDSKYIATFTVPYEAGVIEATGYRDGTKVAAWKLETAGEPANAVVSIDRSKLKADGIDLAYVSVQLVDAKGRPVYDTRDDRDIALTVTGKGVLAGAGSGKPYGTPSFQSGKLTSFHGRAVAVVRATQAPGNITVQIVTKGLPQKTVTLTTAR